MFDVNLSFGECAFDHFVTGQIEAYLETLFGKGINGGLVADLESITKRNTFLCNELHFYRMAMAPDSFVPVYTLNPLLPGWGNHAERLGASVVRMLPGHHGYELSEPVADACADWCEERRIPLLVPLRFEDERSWAPSYRPGKIKAESVQAFAIRHPQVRMIVLAPYLHEIPILFDATANIGVDISFCDRLFTVKKVLESAPADRVFFGSNAPFFEPEGNILKLTLSTLPEPVIRKISTGNAERFIRGTDSASEIGSDLG
jgi:predicted TIM-barrel fold metal-dependent hydrolase